MRAVGGDILIGVDAGTSVIKAVAFDADGRQIATASTPNLYQTRADGAALQSLEQTWADCAKTLRDLGAKVEGLARRTAAVAVTGQGDGTWLVGKDDAPVSDAWLWLDARAAETVRRLRQAPTDRARFEATGTGLAACQQGPQLALMDATTPDLLDRTETALHCKDWLYLKLTGVRATDPSEASFTFGNFRTRRYDDAVIEALGLGARRGLLPEIVDGTRTTHPLSDEAAAATGLLAGTPISLGFVDMVMTALGAGVYTGGAPAACSVIGSTGVHLRATPTNGVHLNAEGTGYVLLLPAPDMVTQVQSNLAATLNIDWALRLAGDLLAEMGHATTQAELVARIDGWLAKSTPGAILYHPYISEAGERGPFVNGAARAGFVGLSAAHRFPESHARRSRGARDGCPRLLRRDGRHARGSAADGRGGALARFARDAVGRDWRAGAHVGARRGRRRRRGDDGGGGDRSLSNDGRLHRRMGHAAARRERGAEP